jgi:hypothetical protein
VAQLPLIVSGIVHKKAGFDLAFFNCGFLDEKTATHL